MEERPKRLANLRQQRNTAIREAERSAFAYFAACRDGERSDAAQIHEYIYCVGLLTGVFGTPGQSSPDGTVSASRCPGGSNEFSG